MPQYVGTDGSSKHLVAGRLGGPDDPRNRLGPVKGNVRTEARAVVNAALHAVSHAKTPRRLDGFRQAAQKRAGDMVVFAAERQHLICTRLLISCGSTRTLTPEDALQCARVGGYLVQ